MARLNWERARDRSEPLPAFAGVESEEALAAILRAPSKADLRAQADRAIQAWGDRPIEREADEPGITTCSLPDPVPIELTCDECGHHASLFVPLAKLSATLRCSICGTVALPF